VNPAAAAAERKLLYVATPGVRNYLEYGGHGILVFDINDSHKFVKRIRPRAGQGWQALECEGNSGERANASALRQHDANLDVFRSGFGKLLWEKPYEGGCDRMAITPDGKTIYLPSLENAHWHVVDAKTGEVIKKIVTNSGAHNTIVGLDGRFAYLAGLKSPILRVADTRKREVVRDVGPFGNVIRPFTITESKPVVMSM